MEAKQLQEIDDELNINSRKDNILINKRGFYLYYNEPNKRIKDIKIHGHNCGYCAFGSGRVIEKEPGKNGVWIGPFSSTEQAESFARKILMIEDVSSHSCC